MGLNLIITAASRMKVRSELLVRLFFFVLVAFLVVFREEEGLYDGDENKCQILYAALPSRSTFKGKTGEIFHLIVITIKCNSGLEIGPFF